MALGWQRSTNCAVKGDHLEQGKRPPQPRPINKPSPFRPFKTSPEIIRLAVMLFVRFALSLRQLDDLLHKRCVGVSHEAIRYSFRRFGGCYRPRSVGNTAGTRL
jgi:putative transposase